MCSGVIVSSKNVLTTATCINTLAPADVEVRVGSQYYYTGGFLFAVSAIVQNPHFQKSTYESNIAILTVVGAFNLQLSNVRAIPLASTLPATGSTLIGSAFGATDPQLTLPDTLQKVNIKAFSLADCKNYKRNRLTESMFCAGDVSGHKDFCPADQGAPLVYQGELSGIYSWGCSCGLSAPTPSSPVFNSIPYFRSWIQSNTV